MMRKAVKVILRITTVLFLAALIYAAVCAVSIVSYAKKDETCKAEAAIILGAGADEDGVSPVFRERLHHGVMLYNDGYVKKLIITGGVGEGNEHSDAYIGMQYVIGEGVPAEDILIEETSTITEENLENAAAIMDEEGLSDALIVSDPLHMKRAMLMAADKGLEAHSSPTATSMYRSTDAKLRFLAREVFFYCGYRIVRIFR